jgi:hypothetical protein
MPADLAPPLEKEEQRRVVELFRLAGCRVHTTSQYRASHVAVGLPDLIVFHEGARAQWWFEVKRYEAKGFNPWFRKTWHPFPLRADQAEFRRVALACGQRHYFGGIVEAEAVLVEIGLGQHINGAFTLTKARITKEA